MKRNCAKKDHPNYNPNYKTAPNNSIGENKLRTLNKEMAAICGIENPENAQIMEILPLQLP